MSRSLRPVRLALLAVDPHCCYCGGELTEENSSLDHIVPQARGGTNRRENLLLACRDCNSVKAAMTPQDLIQWCAVVLAVAVGRMVRS